MKTLLLISPVAPASLLGKDFYFRLPCLSLLKVAAATPAGWSVRIVDEKVEPLGAGQTADLVGITAMTCTAPRAYALADEFRRRGVPVVLGGMHPSSLPEEALQHADAVLVGEAEGLWPELIKDFESGRLEGVYRHHGARPSLAGLAPADWSLYAGKRYLPVHFVETTRGCPLDCEFCAVTQFFGGRYRNRPLEEVLAELEALEPFDGRFILKNMVFFVDDNILSNRAYTRGFLQAIAGRGWRWLGHASVSLADDPEILELCQASGCIGVLIGFETLSEETMQSIGRKSRLRMEYLEAIKKIHDHGIGVDGSFVFGFDTDDASVFERTLEFVLKAKIEVPYFSILTPYPGTRLYERMRREGRLLSQDWALYDTSHVVFQPARMTVDGLTAGYQRAFLEAYSLRNTARRLWRSTAYKNFFVPMNLGFRGAVRAMARAVRGDQSGPGRVREDRALPVVR